MTMTCIFFLNCIYNSYWCDWRSTKVVANLVLLLRKNLANKFWRTAKQGSKIFNDIPILHSDSSAIKELSKSLIFKNNLYFLKKWEFCVPQPFPSQFHLSSNFDGICVKHLYLIDCWEVKQKLNKLPPPP